LLHQDSETKVYRSNNALFKFAKNFRIKKPRRKFDFLEDNFNYGYNYRP